MSTEQNKAAVKRVLDGIWSKGNIALVDELLGRAYRGHTPRVEMDRDGLRRGVTYWRTAFPDLCVTADDMIAEEEQVATRFRATGTHRGEYLGVAATGRRFAIGGTLFSRFDGGKLVEEWHLDDTYELMQQLGATPTGQ